MMQMVLLLLLVSAAFTVLVFCESSSNDQCKCECSSADIVSSRIVNGEETQENELPWLVAISDSTRSPDSPLCGGALITRRHVLTAGHCLQGFIKPVSARVYVGMKNITTANHGIIPDKLTIHEEIIENTTGIFNDIGILRLSKPINFSKNIQPACLQLTEEEDESEKENASVMVAGWGVTRMFGQRSEVLLKAQLTIISEKECFSIFNMSIPKEQICVGEAEGIKDACQGDSGGPLHQFNSIGMTLVIGIVSFGNGCALPNSPGIYTRVVSYSQWIKNNVDNEPLCYSI